MKRIPPSLLASLLFTAATGPAAGEEVFLRFEGVPEDGLLVAGTDLTAAAKWAGIGPVAPEGIRATADRGAIVQFVPAADFDPEHRIRGVLVARLPGGGSQQVRLEFSPGASKPGAKAGTVEAAGFEIAHDPAKQGGLPSRLLFRGTGKTLSAMRWQDRLHHAQLGSFRLADDSRARVTRIAEGPLCVAVRVDARFVRTDGTAPQSKPEAVYHWHYLRDQPLIYVTAIQRQQQPFEWKEAHFLECHPPDDELPQWAGGDPVQKGTFQGADKSRRFRDWAALHDGRNALALLRSGDMLIYDGKGGYGPYLHAHGSQAWESWNSTERRLSAWLWIGNQENPLETIAEMAGRLPMQGRATVTVGRVQERLEQVRAAMGRLGAEEQRQARRNLAAAGRLEAQGRFQEALDAAAGKLPAAWHTLTAGNLSLALEQTAGGIRALQLLDAATGVELMAPQPLPLLSLTLRRTGAKEDTQVTAEDGWDNARVERLEDRKVKLAWSDARAQGLEGLRVELAAAPDEAASAIRWTLRAEPPAGWILREIAFPQIAVADLGREAEVVFPRGPGEVQRDLWRRAFRYTGRYPNGWTVMPWLAAYDAARRTGLYVAVHDPGAATKEIELESRPAGQAVDFAFQHPPAGMDEPGRAFQLPGEAVWQLLRGDWFDAARIYRQWAMSHAKWWPDTGPEGRPDTPLWMRELPVWALASGKPESVVPAVKKFASALGVPVGVHWYNWHQIPFDNDYPHYFPALEGFQEGVAELQRSRVHVMPYINGRLWDSRDRGLADFEFTQVARAAATKDEAGEPYLESYGSKEQDGSRVRLAAMCPVTPVWRNKVGEIVGRLVNGCGVHGVYIDQVAAAKPELCFDRAHGHPAGGGDWWTAGYWDMLGNIRQSLPADRMLTTECNAEPYAHVFDGYLTWHWQYDGQVPAFPAVYGGVIQMFGRAYRGGPAKDLALRMKAGQQLVFGEQIGWLSPSVVTEPENFAFLRQIVALRWQLKRYFYAGQMARPPKLTGAIPCVTADWQWSGEWPVTTAAAMAGAWSMPAAQRLVLLFVNAGDQSLTLACEYETGQAGLPGEVCEAVAWSAEGVGARWTASRSFRREISLPPRSAQAWELMTKRSSR